MLGLAIIGGLVVLTVLAYGTYKIIEKTQEDKNENDA